MLRFTSLTIENFGPFKGNQTIDFTNDNGVTIIWGNNGRGKTTLWGDRIFEKCGIRRDEGGDGGKTLEIRGKRRLSARDGGANYQQS